MNKGAVTISTSMEMTIVGAIISLAIGGGAYLNNKIDSHTQSDGQIEVQNTQQIATMATTLADLKDSDKQNFDTLNAKLDKVIKYTTQ